MHQLVFHPHYFQSCGFFLEQGLGCGCSPRSILSSAHCRVCLLSGLPGCTGSPGAISSMGGYSCGVGPLSFLLSLNSEALLAAEQGLSCCLVTTATFQKCTLLQPASQTNGFERNSCSFRIIFILFFLKKKGKKKTSFSSSFAPLLPLFPRIWSHKGE